MFSSEFPLIIVSKRDGKIRIIISYLGLNSASIVGKWTLPRIDEVLDSLGNSTMFSTLDLRSEFFQNAIDLDSIEFIAFVIEVHGHAAAPSASARFMLCVTENLEHIHMCRDGAIARASVFMGLSSEFYFRR